MTFDAPPAPIHWPAEALWEALAPLLPGFTVEVLPRIDSSNTELMRRLRSPSGRPPQPEPVLLVAEEQTAGRGRSGRTWRSQRGDSLTFSLSLPLAPADWSGLSLVVGLAVANALDPLTLLASTSLASTSLAFVPRQSQARQAPRIRLKWPNDLWITVDGSERKLGGVLVETTSVYGQRHAVIGIGLNIAAPPAPLQPDSAATASLVSPGTLRDLHPGANAATALLALVPPLVAALHSFERHGFAPFRAGFAARDALAGRSVQLSGAEALQGIAQGVSENGALLVQTAAGMSSVTSAEVSVRPLMTATAATTSSALPPGKAAPC